MIPPFDGFSLLIGGLIGSVAGLLFAGYLYALDERAGSYPEAETPPRLRPVEYYPSLADSEDDLEGLEIEADTSGLLASNPDRSDRYSEGFSLIREIYATSQGAVEAWGREPERWMVVEESGELLDTFAKYQRGRAEPDDVAEEAADQIMVSVHACAAEQIPLGLLWKHLILKLGRTKNRVSQAGVWGTNGEDTEVASE